MAQVGFRLVRLRRCVYLVLALALGGCGAGHEKGGQADQHANGGNSSNTTADSPPTAYNGSVSTSVNVALHLVLGSDVDGDPLSVTMIREPTIGTLSPAGAVKTTYTPGTGRTGNDFFKFKVSDGELSATGTVRITVTGSSQGPVCRDVSSLKSFGRLPCGAGATYTLADPGSCSASLDSAGYYGVSSGASYPCSFTFKANVDGMTITEKATVTHS